MTGQSLVRAKGIRVRIQPTELERWGYQRCGSVLPELTPVRFVGSRGYGLFVVYIPGNLSGWVTYVHVMDDEFMKCGTVKPDQSLMERMNSSYNSLRKPIDLLTRGLLRYFEETLYIVDPDTGGVERYYAQDFPWKHRVPPAMLAGRSVVLWAKLHKDKGSMESEETILNNAYRGEWSKEGWSDLRHPDGKPLRRRILPEAQSVRQPG